MVTVGVTAQVAGLVAFVGAVVTAQVRLTAPLNPLAGVAVFPLVAEASKLMLPLLPRVKVGGGA
jgi:hypothetical protein